MPIRMTPGLDPTGLACLLGGAGKRDACPLRRALPAIFGHTRFPWLGTTTTPDFSVDNDLRPPYSFNRTDQSVL